MSVQKTKEKSMRWTAEIVTMFVEEIHEEVVVKGTATENGMKKETWNAIQKEINRKSSLKLEKDQLQSKYSELKSKYGIFQKIVENSGFGWDEELELCTAPDAVWDAYILLHPKAREFRGKTLPNYNLLHEIFGGRIATGKYASNGDAHTFDDVDEEDAERKNDDDDDDEAEGQQTDEVQIIPVTVAGKRPAVQLKTPLKTPSKKKLKPIEAVTEMLGKLVEQQTKTIGHPEDTTVDRATKHFSDMFAYLPAKDRMTIKKILRNKDNAELYLSFDDEEKREYVDSELQN